MSGLAEPPDDRVTGQALNGLYKIFDAMRTSPMGGADITVQVNRVERITLTSPGELNRAIATMIPPGSDLDKAVTEVVTAAEKGLDAERPMGEAPEIGMLPKAQEEILIKQMEAGIGEHFGTGRLRAFPGADIQGLVPTLATLRLRSVLATLAYVRADTGRMAAPGEDPVIGGETISNMFEPALSGPYQLAVRYRDEVAELEAPYAAHLSLGSNGIAVPTTGGPGSGRGGGVEPR